ncbi:MAG TPA: flagellar hook-basal body complex protein FliE [Terriglobales bacterium]|nr:flagellar hook-basal body complex protein FliE [Terriglobales bacterium]
MIFPGLPNFPTAPTSPTAPAGMDDNAGGGFGSVLHQAIDKVGELGNESDKQISELVQGNRQDIHNVMIAVEKADVAFQLMMQVRNKIVNAYQEVSKLQF